MISAIYEGDVHHARFKPKRHRLHYRVFSLLLDLDELPTLNSRVFGYNRPALFSFWDKDHGDGQTGSLRAWVERQLRDAGHPEAAAGIRILCYPRILGYVFNPLTQYYCHDAAGTLRVILHEVCNTYGERMTYVIPVAPGETTRVRQLAPKLHFVSPFVPMDCAYQFDIAPPGERISVSIAESDPDGPLLIASFAGQRREWSDRELLRLFIRYPLMTLKVTAGIHYEAAKLIAKGIRIHPHPKVPNKRASVLVPRQQPAIHRQPERAD